MALVIPKLARRTGSLGLALTAWDMWRRIPPAQRRALLAGARTHGPRLVKTAATAATAAAASKGRKPPA
jgi:hypothetical protein